MGGRRAAPFAAQQGPDTDSSAAAATPAKQCLRSTLPFWVGVSTPAAAQRRQIQQRSKINTKLRIPAEALAPLSRCDRATLEHLAWTDGLLHGKALEEQVFDTLR